MLDVLREEKKYRLTLDSANYLFSKMSQVLHGDPYNGLDYYMVRSLYFDSIYDRDFFEKYQGMEYRKKIRLRVYRADSDSAKLEMKEKCGSAQRKRSLTVSKEDALELIAGRYECLLNYSEDIASEFYYIMTTELYQPRCVVEYKRRAFATQENSIRITFDSELVSNEGYFNIFDPNLPVYPITPKDEVLLEVKYNNFLLSYIKDVLECVDRVETSNSKYCMARKYGMMGE